ncbi:hypothetical protein AAFC00_000077 [Neodothiora populina]|uniref:YMC020W-like alpha/beta hydrolase domain-containing protein n=1 Tax=Neodothiora populina TaxID=2781224 RepID=A0ABR3P1V7_9PEZI
MGPRNKKHKPNHPASAGQDHDQVQSHENAVAAPPAKPEEDAAPDDDTQSQKPERRSSRASWYNKSGSWRAKASPVAQATRESISVAGGATSEALAEGSAQVARYMHNTLKRSSKSIPSLPSESRVNVTGIPSDLDRPRSREAKEETKEIKEDDVPDMKVREGGTTTTTEDDSRPPDDAPLPPDPIKDTASQPDSTQTQLTSSQRGWWGWWSRPDGYNTQPEKADDSNKKPDHPDQNETSNTPLPTSPAQENPPAEENAATPALPIADPPNAPVVAANKDLGYGSTRSWFGLWSKAQNTQQRHDESSTLPQPSPPENTVSPEPTPPQAVESTIPGTHEPEHPAPSPPTKSAAGWAFWSREQKPGNSSTPNGTQTQRQIGELAVADTPSQSHPEAAQFNQEREQKSKAKRIARSASLKTPKNATFSASPNIASAPDTPTTASPAQTRANTPEPGTGKTNDASKSTSAVKATKPSDRPANMVLPAFRDTYTMAQVPSYWERATQYVASSLRIIDAPVSKNHVAISPTLPKIKNAVAIGVHGYFPAPLIQKVLGPPTGTSIRFANHASAAIRAWAEKNQPDIDCEIETVALEGEGFIADRVNTLWKLLLNWLSHLRTADLIFVACHSQGVPVAVMLVSKLIQLGCLSPHAKISICAMAGVNLGPFADYKSRLLGAGSAAELFDFSRPASKVSMEYATALDVVLRHNVRITYAGSIDDQLVSLESSTFSTLTHPYVYRCVFVDGRVHAPDFITHLVAFALKLRNLGISDHGLIRELSLPLAGSLYGGQGHSTVYDDPAVYDLALEFCLETTDVVPGNSNNTMTESEQQARHEAALRRSSRGGPPSSIDAANALRRGSISNSSLATTGIPPVLAPFELPASGSNANPYFLPWALRGILEEDVVKKDMGDEVREIVGEFEEWRPVSKVLKDVRFRLEGVRSKL